MNNFKCDTCTVWLQVRRHARSKAKPNTLIHEPHWRIRSDKVDVRGHFTLRYLGKVRHLSVSWKYRGESIRLYVLDDVVTFATEDGDSSAKPESTPTAATSRRAKAFDSLHGFGCSR